MTDRALPRVVDQIRAAVERSPEQPCVIAGDAGLSYRAIWDRAGAASRELAGQGVRPGHKAAILSANSVDCVVAMVGLLRLGAAWIPINHRDAAASITDVLHRFGCHVLLAAGDRLDDVGPLCEAVPSMRLAVELGSGRALVAGALPAPDPADLDLAAVFATGGTTGTPKGVAFTHERLGALIGSYVRLFAAPDDVYLAAAPLTHVSGRICLGVLAGGGTVVVLPAFEPGAVLDAIERHRVTTTTVVPTMLHRLLDHPGVRRADTSSLRTLAFGGGPTAISRVREALDVFGPVLEAVYGQTEAPLMITRMAPAEFVGADGRPVDDYVLGSVGRPTPASEVRIVDEHGEPVAAGRTGEIVVRGAFTMAGYYRDPELTAARRHGSFWRTGDVGRLDDRGYLTIVGRSTDLIITGGFNVYPAEVENAAMTLPGVRECAAFGLPDPEWGEVVAIAVVADGPNPLDPAAIVTELRERLGGVKAPKIVHLLDELPRNANGKLLKRLIAETVAQRR